MRYIFILLLLLFSCISYGQIDIINQSLTDSSQNIFYIGVDNAIELKGVKNEAEYNVTVKRAGSRMRHEIGNRYLVQVATVVDTCLVIVNDKNGKKVFERNYQTRTLTHPIAALAGQNNSAIKISRILANPFLNVILPGCYYRIANRITSFRATFIHNADSLVTIGTDNLLSTEQISMIRTLKTGDKIYFDKIRVTNPKEQTGEMLPFWIKIE